MTNKTAYILAGEPSGDRLAASLMRSHRDEIGSWHGIGGPLMTAEGLQSSASYEGLQIIGLMAALRSYRQLKSLLNHLVEEACALRPDVIFTIDAKAFSLRFAKALRQRMAQEGWSAPIIHMVAPTIWAYGAGRRHAFEDVFDGMLCLFPMERSAFDTTKVKIGYIGHPAAYEAHMTPAPSKKILILPGSRSSEISTLLPVFLETANAVSQIQGLRLTIATLPDRAEQVENIVNAFGIEADLITEMARVRQAMATHDIMIAASGTVTLETALCALPGIVAYRLNPLLGFMMRHRFYQSDPVLPNIILQDTLYPFFFQSKVTAKAMQDKLISMMEDYESVQANSAKQAQNLRQSLRTDAPSFEDAIKRALAEMALL